MHLRVKLFVSAKCWCVCERACGLTLGRSVKANDQAHLMTAGESRSVCLDQGFQSGSPWKSCKYKGRLGMIATLFA